MSCKGLDWADYNSRPTTADYNSHLQQSKLGKGRKACTGPSSKQAPMTDEVAGWKGTSAYRQQVKLTAGFLLYTPIGLPMPLLPAPIQLAPPEWLTVCRR